MKAILQKMILPNEVRELLESQENLVTAQSREHLLELALGEKENKIFEVAYEVPGKGMVTEAEVVKCKNGVAVNYQEMYMRRRDPNCMVIADEKPTDKARYEAKYGESFEGVREQTMNWLAEQDLMILPFMAGGHALGYEALLIAPSNAGFFGAALADLQGFVAPEDVREGFTPKAIVYLAPPFRHTHFSGKQVVVHNRLDELHEVFSYNLYPGPSAKKGIYSVLLDIGEREGWVTLHASTVKVITPY
ncbi:MAG: DUF4914 family protein, partial [Cellulosilyticaceae bacterium]